MSKTTRKQDEHERKILFPFKEVQLYNGERVTIKAWDIVKGALMTQRLVLLQQKIARELGKQATMDQVMLIAADELKSIVCSTLDWTPKKFDSKVGSFEDFLHLVEAVWETSINRSDGGGVLPVLVRLAVAARDLTKAAAVVRIPDGTASASQPPSTVSSEPATPSPTSGG